MQCVPVACSVAVKWAQSTVRQRSLLPVVAGVMVGRRCSCQLLVVRAVIRTVESNVCSGHAAAQEHALALCCSIRRGLIKAQTKSSEGGCEGGRGAQPSTQRQQSSSLHPLPVTELQLCAHYSITALQRAFFFIVPCTRQDMRSLRHSLCPGVRD